MIGTVVIRLGAIATAVYLTFFNPTMLGEGTPLMALAIILLFLMDVFGVGVNQTTNPF